MHDIEKATLASLIAKPADGYRAITLHNIISDCFIIGFNRTLFECIEIMLSLSEGFTKQSISVRMQSMDPTFQVENLEEILGIREARPNYWCDLLRQLHMSRIAMTIMDDAKRKMGNVFNAEEVLSGLTEDLFQMVTAWKTDDKDEDEFDSMITEGGFKSFLRPINNMVIAYPLRVPILIGARPGVGKTVYLCNELLYHIFEKKGDWFEPRKDRYAAVFSLELSRKDLMRKMCCILSGLDERKVRGGQLDSKEMELFRAYYDMLRRAPMMIYDRRQTPRQICTNMRYASERNGATFFGIDYVQRMAAYSGTSKDRQFYMRASNDIADTQKNLPVASMLIELSQLSRSSDMSGRQSQQRLEDSTPTLSSFKETGALEEDAFLAGCLYPDPQFMKVVNNEQMIVMELLKNRGGDVGEIKLLFKRRYQKFAPRRAVI